MLKHYLKISLRSIWKDKGYSLVNILGLAVAIACCFLLIFWVKYETSFENCYDHANRIYRVLEVEKRESGQHHSTYIRPGISRNLKKIFPQVEASTFTHQDVLPLIEAGKDGDGIAANVVTVSEDYLRMFPLVYLEGSPQTVAKNKGAILTEEFARKFFGSESAIGKTVVFSKNASYTVDAVVRLPLNTQMTFDVLDVSGEIGYGEHYIMLKGGTIITPKFTKLIKEFLTSTKETSNTLKLQPLLDMHLSSPQEVAISSASNRYGSKSQMVLYSIAALFILVIAIMSYVNTSIARAINRLKEVGVRKVTGSNRRQLIERFLCEAFIISAIAVLLSIVIVNFLFPYFSEIMGNTITLEFDLSTILIAVGVCLAITLLSGGYAAFYLSSLNPIIAFRGGSKTGSSNRLRKTLIGLQFFISISIFICTIFIYRQINMMMNANTGVNTENVLVLDTSLWYNCQSFFDIIKSENKNVIDATITNAPPYNAQWGYSGVSWEGSKDEVKEMEFSQIFCDHNYANTFGLELVQGEFIPPGLKWWNQAETKSYNIVINESFKELMGEENPLGITVHYGWGMKGKIIGVVKDFNFKPLKQKISPLIMSFNPEACSKVLIKVVGTDKQATLDFILKKYDEMKPTYATKTPAKYNWVEEDFNKMYEVELRTAKILSVFTIISFILSLMGIFSMVAFMVEKRTKEIAIRKINGAKIFDIARLFVLDITKVATLASLVAIPVCYLLLQYWLEDYAYKTPLSWWIFVLIPLSIIVVTAILVALQVCITANRKPVESLRSE